MRKRFEEGKFAPDVFVPVVALHYPRANDRIVHFTSVSLALSVPFHQEKCRPPKPGVFDVKVSYVWIVRCSRQRLKGEKAQRQAQRSSYS